MDSNFLLDEILSQSTISKREQEKKKEEERKREEKDIEDSIERQLNLLQNTDEFLEKYIYGSGIFDEFVEKHIPAISNLDAFRSRQTETRWKVKQLMKEKIQKSRKHSITKDEMKKDIAEYYMKHSVWNTKTKIAFQNYLNSEDVKREIIRVMVDEKIKLVPEGEQFLPIIHALEKEKVGGNNGSTRKSRFSSTIPEKNQNLSKPSVIDISAIKTVYAHIKEEMKPKLLPPINLTTQQYNPYIIPKYYTQPPYFNPNIPPPIFYENTFQHQTNATATIPITKNEMASPIITQKMPTPPEINLGPVDISDSDSDMSMDSPDEDSKETSFSMITPPPPPPCLFDSMEDEAPPPPPIL
uniref:DUF148 domain-containing protein n=1 Tax=Parastrongyloides trichosuri TaxID=131310 RepID=A0A0N5A1J3_PARTI